MEAEQVLDPMQPGESMWSFVKRRLKVLHKQRFEVTPEEEQ